MPTTSKRNDFCKIVDSCLPLEDGSVWSQTLGKRVSDDPRHFIFRRPKKKSMNIFDNFFGGTIFANFFSKCLFLKRYDILDVTGSCSSKNDPRGFEIQPSAALGGGVKRSVYVFWLDIWRQNTFKKTYNSSKSVGFFFKKNLHNKKTYAY